MSDETIPEVAETAPVAAPAAPAAPAAAEPTLAEALAENAILKAQVADLQTKLALARRA